MPTIEDFQKDVEEVVHAWAANNGVTVENRAARLIQIAGQMLVDKYGAKDAQQLLGTIGALVTEHLPELEQAKKPALN
ncbi:MAG: hypothetical protein J0H31_08215 [Alphaproteobacteria bacterium]|nr:hypothetical protein [Alphaproteobacteria bacterium]